MHALSSLRMVRMGRKLVGLSVLKAGTYRGYITDTRTVRTITMETVGEGVSPTLQ